MTPAGDEEFRLLLRQAWWKVEQAPDPLVPALALMVFMSRAELITAVQARVAQRLVARLVVEDRETDDAVVQQDRAARLALL